MCCDCGERTALSLQRGAKLATGCHIKETSCHYFLQLSASCPVLPWRVDIHQELSPQMATVGMPYGLK